MVVTAAAADSVGGRLLNVVVVDVSKRQQVGERERARGDWRQRCGRVLICAAVALLSRSSLLIIYVCVCVCAYALSLSLSFSPTAVVADADAYAFPRTVDCHGDKRGRGGGRFVESREQQSR